MFIFLQYKLYRHQTGQNGFNIIKLFIPADNGEGGTQGT